MFFSYPRDGQFKMLSSAEDKWYYIDFDNWYLKSPDKWQHYISNYYSSMILKDKIGLIPTISLLTLANVAKEVEDGYREGASYRDLGIGVAGMLAGIFQQDLICYYDSEKILLVYYFNPF